MVNRHPPWAAVHAGTEGPKSHPQHLPLNQDLNTHRAAASPPCLQNIVALTHTTCSPRRVAVCLLHPRLEDNLSLGHKADRPQVHMHILKMSCCHLGQFYPSRSFSSPDLWLKLARTPGIVR